MQVAKSVLEQLPADLNSIRDPEERSTEFLHYRQFFMVWDALDRVVETQALEVPQMTKETRAEWLADYRSTLDAAHELVERLLTTEWLIADSERGTTDKRAKELLRIRQIYIPELIIRLHAMLYSSRARIPECVASLLLPCCAFDVSHCRNLKYTLELANVVADSRYRLYDDFANQPGRRLSDYLGAVRQAILGGLEGGGSDPFRVLTL